MIVPSSPKHKSRPRAAFGYEKPHVQVRAAAAFQRLENCLRRRALWKPTFLRSTSRASRVTKPAFESVGLSDRIVGDQRAGDAVPHRTGLAGFAAAGDIDQNVEV
jgi:hypothetical protein